jgi:hypothetical protein
MTTRTKEAIPQEEVVIEGPQVEVSAELRRMVDKKLKNLIGMWKERKESHKAIVEQGGYLPEGYVYWDCLLLGPYQKPNLDRPSKIVAGGEKTLMVGLIWVNQSPGPGNTVSGSEVMGAHPYNVVFEAANISKWQKYASTPSAGMFPSLAPEFTEVYWEFTPPDPATNRPELYEVHFAVDLDVPGHRFAAFATWHWDPESDGFTPGVAVPAWTPQNPPPGYQIPGTPATLPVGPHFDHDIPARFLVYHKGTST